MNLETMLNNLFEVIYKNPENLSIEYSNVNGKESLKVNGEEYLKDFDDSVIKTKIANYKKNIEALDDCLFVEAMEEIEDEYDLKEVDELFNQESYTQADANLIDDFIKMFNTTIHDKIIDKIDELSNLLEKF